MNLLKINKSLIMLLCLAGLWSCDFGDLNVDPANPNDAAVQTLLPTVQVRQAYMYGGDIARYNGLFTQHLAGVSRQHLVIGRYNFTNSDVNSAWNQMYRGTFRDMKVIIDKSAVNGANHYSAITKILQADMIGVASDLWGNVPFSQAGLGSDNLNPAYDSRDSIYMSIHQLLAEARTALAQPTEIPVTGDFYYGGDVDAWTKASYALDARYYLHRGQLDEALAAVQQSFDTPADDLVFDDFSDSPTTSHPLQQFEEQRGDIRMGKFFVDLMKSINDPRLPFFAAQFDTLADGSPNYVGVAAGDDNESASLTGPYYNSRDAVVNIISYAETKFIEAEIIQRQGGDPTDALKEAITASVMQVTGAAADAAFVDAQVAGITDLESLITQKYIALFYQLESFNDLRRTGFPALQPAQGASVEQSEGKIPERWPYPINERLFNEDVYNANNPDGAPLAPKLSWE
ncbi:SusD/RagB family nutrient-binding outer membrane lipoprotein [Persicobacter psychrovividus]|uniref:SusD/RagB family nutrient-binding outer membrane lipoprotein n=1 Tax=Persicobacter psychrovividus TaxID=387638 RepID=A0ABM7VEW9_9BACT|nr:hypothetical protein PEPS_17380 [Persicobacter psychrovividus]